MTLIKIDCVNISGKCELKSCRHLFSLKGATGTKNNTLNNEDIVGKCL